MFGLLLQVSGIDDADVWNHHDVGSTRVAAFAELAAGAGVIRHAWRVEKCVDRGAVIDLPESNCCRVVLQGRNSVRGAACIREPDLGNVVLGQTEPVVGVAINGRKEGANESGGWRAVVAGVAWDWEETVRVDRRLSVL